MAKPRWKHRGFSFASRDFDQQHFVIGDALEVRFEPSRGDTDAGKATSRERPRRDTRIHRHGLQIDAHAQRSHRYQLVHPDAHVISFDAATRCSAAKRS